MTTSITSTTTTINTTMMITIVTVMTDKTLLRVYLGAIDESERLYLEDYKKDIEDATTRRFIGRRFARN